MPRLMRKKGLSWGETNEVSTLDETVVELLGIGPMATQDLAEEDELPKTEGGGLHLGIPQDVRVAIEAHLLVKLGRS